VTDWRRNPAHPQFGRFGQLVVRRGKSARGSPPRRRVVLTVFPWSVTAVETYLAEVRPWFVDRYPDTGAMFPTERGQRITPKQINARFASLREEAGLDRHLGPHCLRHTYITTLLERGWPLALVQEQSGHSHAATTGIYTALSDDFKNRWIYRALGGPFTDAGGREKDA
jgi:integrase/recombinase XerC